MPEENASPAVDTGAQDNLQSETQEGSTSQDWFDSLHEDLKMEKTLEKFKTEDGLNKLTESYVNLEKRLGKSIIVPGDNATEQDVYDFRKKLGIPETPDKYELKYKEHEQIKIDESTDKEWKSFAHKIGLTPKQAQALTDFEFSRMEADIARSNKQYQEAEEELRQEFGNGFQNVLDRANNVLRTYADEKDMEAIKPYQNDVRLVRLLAKIGSQMSEHDFKTGDPVTQQDTKNELLKKAEELQRIYTDTNRDIIERKRANKEAQEIYEKIYGTAEVSSSANVKF